MPSSSLNWSTRACLCRIPVDPSSRRYLSGAARDLLLDTDVMPIPWLSSPAAAVASSVSVDARALAAPALFLGLRSRSAFPPCDSSSIPSAIKSSSKSIIWVPWQNSSVRCPLRRHNCKISRSTSSLPESRQETLRAIVRNPGTDSGFHRLYASPYEPPWPELPLAVLPPPAPAPLLRSSG